MSTHFGTVFQVNTGLVEEVFLRYSADPASVSPEWRAYFEGFNEGFFTATKLAESRPELEDTLRRVAQTAQNNGEQSTPQSSAAQQNLPTDKPTGKTSAQATLSLNQNAQSAGGIDFDFERKVFDLVCAYKAHGHLHARINPLFPERSRAEALALESFHLSAADLERVTLASISLDPLLAPMPLKSLIAALEVRYCGTVGAQFEHIDNPEERRWLHEAFAGVYAPLNGATRKQIFTELAKADAFEKTLATKYIGKKRFSIEGADAQIPAIESFIEAASALGAKEFSLAMAHRGRLNILVHCAHKPLELLFAEFEGYPNPALQGDGDVKYHGGYECERQSRQGTPVRVSVSCNPSHLEFVDAVVMGEVRAKQVRHHAGDMRAVIPFVMHGDAAVAGQGVVYETLQMMNLKGYAVGGTVHLVANNQVGFTTNPDDARSAEYCTEVAKIVQAPVFHVNAEDLDALHNVMCLAAKYRQRYLKDVFIDLMCFRRHGHNETDEPNFTQPLLYKIIKGKPAPFEQCLQKLVAVPSADGVTFTEQELTGIYADIRASMNAIFDKVRAEHTALQMIPRLRGWAQMRQGSVADMIAPVPTAVPVDSLKAFGRTLCTLPADFVINPKLGRTIIGERLDMVDEKRRMDWAMGELLAYASLLSEGYSVRISGQDVRRSTFGHRHVSLVDFDTGRRTTAVAQCAQHGARFDVVDSLLSETAVLGYEYGYAIQHEKALVVWEAQFGDFVNGAQVIIDQFIASGESKWGISQSLVMLMPHGHEGQGPEHSSSRIERFLQLAAQGNMQVCYFTTAAQLFHALRRQVLRDFRKPLIIASPKSFLRNPRAGASFADLATGSFQEILDDPRAPDTKKVKKLVLCTGKIAIDAFDFAEKADNKIDASDVAVVRVEQLYPFAEEKIAALLKRYAGVTHVAWAQEEPKNMGAYSFIALRLQGLFAQAGLKKSLGYIGRSERASPAVGLEKVHNIEQEALLRALWAKDVGQAEI